MNKASQEQLISHLAGQLEQHGRRYIDYWWETRGRVTVDWRRLAEIAVGNILADPELLQQAIRDEYGDT